MVICGSYMFAFSVGQDMKKQENKGYKENSSISSNTNCQELKINVE